jgi:UPF0042 nucleotide-binding protein
VKKTRRRTVTSRRRSRTTRRNAARPARFIVVTGLSGAGKSHALRALEDLGCFCVDNLPVALIPAFANLVLGKRPQFLRAAVVVDVREGRELARFPHVFRGLTAQYHGGITLIFLEATDATLLRRFNETRRPHPLAAAQPVADGISRERRMLQPLRQLASQVVDTSRLNVHDLRRIIHKSASATSTRAPLLVTVTSFGFRRGTPPEADLVFDVRFLPNPHFVTGLRQWSGLNPRVSRYVLKAQAAGRFLTLTTGLLRFLVPQYIAEGKTYLTIGIGCTGGRHRSVAITEALGRRLRSMRGIEVRLRHRDVADA